MIANDYNEFLQELQQQSEEAKSQDGTHQRDAQYSNFENMLFERVVAKSHEEITDEAILELEKDPEMQMDSDGSHSSSPQKAQKENTMS